MRFWVQLCTLYQAYYVQDDILMWGGYAGRETRPQHVASNWSLAAEFMPNFTLMVSLVAFRTYANLCCFVTGYA